MKIFELFHNNKIFFYLKKNSLFLIMSVIVGLLMGFVALGIDDITLYERSGYTPLDWWKVVENDYFNFSSRVIINFIWFAVLHGGRIVFSFYTAISFFVLLKALELIFFSKQITTSNIFFIICIVMLFPFDILSTAGWITTFTSYFGPQAFAVMALVPIRKVYNAEKIKTSEFILYCLCLIYGTNAEQMCMVVFLIYTTALIYFICKKQYNKKIFILFFLSLSALIFMLTCPGNFSRAADYFWFPTFGVLDFVDKADIGLSTTLKWLFSGNSLLIIFLFFYFCVFVFCKFKNPFFGFIALVPIISILFLGLFSSITELIVPYATILNNDVPYYGAFNVETHGYGASAIQFDIYLFLLFCICIIIILLNSKIESFIADAVLFVGGIATRIMMGFAPSVYVSSTRTYSTFIFCLILLATHIYSNNFCFLPEKYKKIEIYLFFSLVFLSFTNLAFAVFTIFR